MEVGRSLDQVLKTLQDELLCPTLLEKFVSSQERRRYHTPGMTRQAISTSRWFPSGLSDTLTNKHHSQDFNFARSEYLRTRVMFVAMVFALLTPVWAMVDYLIIPGALYSNVLLARALMMGALTLVMLITRRSRISLDKVRHSVALLMLSPALFYLAVLLMLGDYQSHDLTGYSFIPFLLVAFLSVFPLTLLESFGIGMIILILELISQYKGGQLLTPLGWQDLWLLCTLMAISLWANHSQVSTLMRLYRQASLDPLTGLLNRGVLLESLDQLIAKRKEDREDSGKAAPLTLLMLDLDRFKRINDTHGHSIGDQVLKSFAAILRSELRESDIIARYGGEEFIIVLPGTPKSDALGLAERIRHHCEKTRVYNHQGETVSFTTSIGVAELRGEEAIEAMLLRLDNRLYEAKAKGRNCIVST